MESIQHMSVLKQKLMRTSRVFSRMVITVST